MTRSQTGGLLIAMVCLLAPAEATSQRLDSPKLWGLAYGTFRDGQAPGTAYPSKAEIAEDMKILRGFTTRLRTYAVAQSEQLIPRMAKQANLMIYAGAHIDSDPAANAEEIERLIAACEPARCAGLVVGNEPLLHGNLTVDQLIEVIRAVKSDPRVIRRGMRVGYADTEATLLANPALAAELDFLLVNVHPYWAGIPVEEAADYVVERWLLVESAYPEKEVIIGETGWPTEGDPFGDAIPNQDNQQLFLETFVPLALERNVPYFFFAAFDEEWKGDASGVELESHWGLWYSDRTMKPVSFFEAPPPMIEILRVPGCFVGDGRMEKIGGKVWGISHGESSSYRVVLYAKTNQWYVQPYATRPLTSIRPKLDWSNRIFLGYSYAAALVPQGCSPPPQLESLPAPDEEVFPGIPVPGCEAPAVAVRNCE